MSKNPQKTKLSSDLKAVSIIFKGATLRIGYKGDVSVAKKGAANLYEDTSRDRVNLGGCYSPETERNLKP